MVCVLFSNACHSYVLPSVFVDGAPRAFVAKTKSNQSQGPEATLLKVLHSCLVSNVDVANLVSFLNQTPIFGS